MIFLTRATHTFLSLSLCNFLSTKLCYSDCYAQAGLSYCEQQQDNGGDNNNNAAQQGNNDGFVYKQRLAHFQLCPTNTCGSSKRGCNDYVTDLSEFLAMYVMNKMEVEATACENVREGCDCEDVNDDGVS